MPPATMVSLRHVPSKALHVSKPVGWLESRFHFCFADYYNPKNTNFGVLRVMNDDLVRARSGFPPHPHRDYEIFSYVVKGELTHQDSMGSKETLGRGESRPAASPPPRALPLLPQPPAAPASSARRAEGHPVPSPPPAGAVQYMSAGTGVVHSEVRGADRWGRGERPGPPLLTGHPRPSSRR